MDFWKMCYDLNCISFDDLKKAVITNESPCGEITAEQFKTITGKDFTQ